MAIITMVIISRNIVIIKMANTQKNENNGNDENSNAPTHRVEYMYCLWPD